MVKVARSKPLRKKKVVLKNKLKHQKSLDDEVSSTEGNSDDQEMDNLTMDFDLPDEDSVNKATPNFDSEDSDYELQVALKEGILQNNGLNILQEKPREKINKRKEMEEKLLQFQKKQKWIETLAVSFSPELTYTGPVNSDFEREAAFMKQAQDAVATALPKLHTLNVPIFRPDDYFAEMAKSDTHMQKVRHHILDIQKDKEQRESSRRLREEKRFAVKVQGVAEERKRKEKRKLLEAVKKHRKGMKGQLEQMLNNNSKLNMDEEEDSGVQGGKFKGNKKISRDTRDKKFGFGGKKKRSKQNDKNSFENPFGTRKKHQQNFGKKRRGRTH